MQRVRTKKYSERERERERVFQEKIREKKTFKK